MESHDRLQPEETQNYEQYQLNNKVCAFFEVYYIFSFYHFSFILAIKSVKLHFPGNTYMFLKSNYKFIKNIVLIIDA